MAVWAMRFLCVYRCDALSTKYIFAVSNWLQVIRIDAAMHAAQMI